MFYNQYSKPFWYFIFKICGDENMAHDVFQESFYRFFRAAPRQLNDHQKKSYLYKTAFRLIIDQKKRIQVEKKFQPDVYTNDTSSENQDLSMDMERVFRLLKPRERTLLWLAYVEGYNHKEISDITHAGEKSIKVQLFRIRKKFSDILTRYGFSREAFP